MKSNGELLTRAVSKVIPKDLAEKKLVAGKPLRIYWGIDPTGSKIHLGHTVAMRKLQAFADAGHHVILVIGSFTAMIGDPSDREAMRQPLTRKEIDENVRTYKEQASKVLDFGSIEVRYNHEWLEKLTMSDIIGIASRFTVQRMEERDMFEKRRKEGKPIGVHEFLYPLMVGYDSVVLDVDCEIGGTDQEFNMLAGRHLQQAFGKREKFVLTTKLVEGTDGRKMSKTYDNCVYVEDAPKDMYGKLMSIKDELITTYLECVTDIPMDEVKRVGKEMKRGQNPRDFKKFLAYEVVKIYHGESEAKAAEQEFTRVFSERGVPEEMPEVKAKKGETIVDVLVRAHIVPSKSEARRLIEQKGIHMNDLVVESIDAKAEEGIVKVGKRKFVRIFSS